MSRNRDLAALFGVLMVAWLLAGFASGFAAKYATSQQQLIDFVLGVLVLVFIPLVRGAARWTALGAGIVGIIWVLGTLYSLVILPIEASYGPAVQLIFSALFAFFSFNAYREKPPAK
jgi:peptidoglycan/LPS O-acetylase OafA/YrhL